MATEVRRTITVYRPRMEVYAYWRELKNLPNFMEHLVSVRGNEDGMTHWVAKAPIGTVEWTAEIVQDRPGEVISWRSVAHADVTNAGEVTFRDAAGGKGAEVEVHLSYDPPAGKLGTIVARLFGEEPDQQIRDDLERFKQIMETGETTISDQRVAGRKGGEVDATRGKDSLVMERGGIGVSADKRAADDERTRSLEGDDTIGGSVSG